MKPPWHPSEIWLWFIEPSPSIAEPERRLQARLLTALLSVLIFTGIFGLILTALDIYPAPKPVKQLIIWIALVGVVALALVYGLSRTAHYRLAAALAVGTLLCATFAVLIINSADPLNLAFLIIGGLMSSLFLSPRATITVFGLTLVGLLLLPVLLRVFPTDNMVSAILFILTVGGLVVMAAILRQSYLEQIEGQTRKLIENEERVKAAMQTARETNVELQTSILVLERHKAEAMLLTEMSDLLQACTSVEEAYRAISHVGPRLFPISAGALFMYSPSRDDLEAVVTWGAWPKEQAGRRFEPGKCWALRLGRPHKLDTLCSGLPCTELSLPLDGLCVPMIAQGESLGVLYQYSEAEDKKPSFNEQFAVTATEQIALAIANLRLRDTLRSQSIQDTLTGLYNRRFMEETLTREVKRAERNQRPLSVIMLDIDHFKQFNDTFGHQAGDVLLREIGQFLQASVRGSDVACRFGGEEFVLILPEAALENAAQKAEGLREKARQLTAVHQGQALGIITVSFGVAAYPEHAMAGEGLLRAADTALYRAKAEGRDRVVVAKGS